MRAPRAKAAAICECISQACGRFGSNVTLVDREVAHRGLTELRIVENHERAKGPRCPDGTRNALAPTPEFSVGWNPLPRRAQARLLDLDL